MVVGNLISRKISIFFRLLFSCLSGFKHANIYLYIQTGLQGVHEITLKNNFIVLAFAWPLWNIGLVILPNRVNTSSRTKILLANRQTHDALTSAPMLRAHDAPPNRFILLRRCANQMNLQAGGTPADSLPLWIGMMLLSWHKTACINERTLRRRSTWKSDGVVSTDIRCVGMD